MILQPLDYVIVNSKDYALKTCVKKCGRTVMNSLVGR
jgi:hypothetical protein